MPRLFPPVVEPGSIAARPQPEVPVDDELRLRPWRRDDVPAAMAAYRDPDIQHWHLRTLETVDEALDWVDATHRSWLSEAAGTWAVTTVRDDHVLGRVKLSFRDLDDGIAEVSYWLLPDARGAGVASRSVVGLSTWAEQTLGLHRLELMHSTQNDRSCRVAVRSQFEPEGVLRSALRHRDGFHDMHLHARLNAEHSG